MWTRHYDENDENVLDALIQQRMDQLYDENVDFWLSQYHTERERSV